ncbi:MbeD family mobilization/exclusion protein [Enterobacter sp. R-1.6.2]
MTEMEKQLLSALESLQASYEQQHQAWQESYSSLQHMGSVPAEGEMTP